MKALSFRSWAALSRPSMRRAFPFCEHALACFASAAYETPSLARWVAGSNPAMGGGEVRAQLARLFISTARPRAKPQYVVRRIQGTQFPHFCKTNAAAGGGGCAIP